MLEFTKRNLINLYDDGIGYVALVDYMGDQYTPAGDARMSTSKGNISPEADTKLQARLLRDRHDSPFEGVVVKFEICIPIFVRAELDRHRTLTKSGELESIDGIAVEYVPDEAMRKWFARNEMSSRYIQMPADYYYPEVVRVQSKTNTQGGGPVEPVPAPIAKEFLFRLRDVTTAARALYNWAVEHNVEKGQARIGNTQNQYTKIRYTGSFKNWADMLRLRLDEGVLWECRRVAEAVATLLTKHFPILMDLWLSQVRWAVTLTAEEAKVAGEAVRLLIHDTENSDEQVMARRALVKKLLNQ